MSNPTIEELQIELKNSKIKLTTILEIIASQEIKIKRKTKEMDEYNKINELITRRNELESQLFEINNEINSLELDY